MVKTELEQRIIDALEAVAVQHGIDVVDVEVTGATKAPCVRCRNQARPGSRYCGVHEAMAAGEDAVEGVEDLV